MKTRTRGVLVKRVEVIGRNEARIFFSDGTVIERAIPGVDRLGEVRVVDSGLGIDPGDGRGEVSAHVLYHRPGGKRYRFEWDYSPDASRAERAARAARESGARRPAGAVRQQPRLTDLDLKLLDAYHVAAATGTEDDIGAPAGLVAQELGLPTAAVTAATRRLAAVGLVEDTGYAMKYERSRIGRGGSWQYIDRPKTAGGMLSKPGASTVWRTTAAGVDHLR